MIDLRRAYEVMLVISGIGIVIDSLERLTSLAKYREHGLFSWVVIRQRLLSMPWLVRRFADFLMEGAECLRVVLLLRLAAVALVVSSPFGSLAFSVALTLLVFGQLYVLVRSGFGTIGADAITLVVCGGAWLAVVVARTPLALRAGMWFVAAQGCLSYFIAGATKLAAPKWRSGEAMTAVMGTHTYGSPLLFKVLRRRPWLSRLGCWSVIAWEATFPCALVVPGRVLVAQLVLGFLFHGSIAGLMGLNLFLAAFPSTYVAIWTIRH
jgi:hypothetical protein